MALQNNMTDQSPWMKALLAANMASPDDGSGGVPTTTAQPTAPGAQGPAATTTQRPLPTQPRREPQIDRIEDDRTAGTRGTTPQASTDPRYAGANYHAGDPARLPLEQQITSDRTELSRLNTPTKPSFMQRLAGGLQGAALGYSGNIGEIATLRDRAKARQQQERLALGQRIEQSTRQLSSEATQEEGMNLRARMAGQAQVAAAERLGQTLSARTELGREQIQGRQDVVDTRTQSAEDIAAANRAERGTESANRLQTMRDIASAHDNVQREIANIRAAAQAAGGLNKIPPQIAKQAWTAKQILPQLDKLEQQTYQIADMLGPLAGRWSEFTTGKVGAPNPAFANYMGQMTFLESAVTLAHSQGRVSNLIFEQFQKLYDRGKQSPENMVEFLRATRDWMQQYASILPEGIGNAPLPGGGSGAATPAPQGQGNVRRIVVP